MIINPQHIKWAWPYMFVEPSYVPSLGWLPVGHPVRLNLLDIAWAVVCLRLQAVAYQPQDIFAWHLFRRLGPNSWICRWLKPAFLILFFFFWGWILANHGYKAHFIGLITMVPSHIHVQWSYPWHRWTPFRPRCTLRHALQGQGWYSVNRRGVFGWATRGGHPMRIDGRYQLAGALTGSL